MAEKAPQFKLNGIYVPQLAEKFLISQDELYDYYHTNSGMYPKNPGTGGGGGGGGGGDETLSGRVATLEESQARQDEDIENLEITTSKTSTKVNKISTTQKNITDAAKLGLDSLSDFILSDDPHYDEIDDIISDQDILKKTQTNFLSAIIDANT